MYLQTGCRRMLMGCALCAAFVLGALAVPVAECRAQAAAVTLSAEAMKTLEGEYTNAADPDTPLSVYVEAGKLWMESERRVPAQLKAVSATEFMIAGSRAQIRFDLQAAGGAELSLLAGEEEKYKRTGAPVRHVFHDYLRTETMIPMRDGVRLHAVILQPTDIKGPLPLLIQRTPYGVDGTSRAVFFAARPELARAGYIYVGVDIRGRFKSEGTFVMSRPLADHTKRKSIDESTDTWDTVDWLVKNVKGNNGRAGFIGTSYPGFLAMMAGIDPHPAVKAISPQAPMIDVWMGDDFFHNGAFRQTYGYDYVFGLESGKERIKGDYGTDAAGKPVDGFDFFLERGNFAEAARRSGVKQLPTLPTWELFLKHPEYSETWRSRGVEYAMKAVTVPTLSVGGYYDQEDMYGPEEEYRRLEAHDTRHENFLVLGPWKHGSWSSSARSLGNLEYGRPIGKEYRAEIEAKFFAKYLKDEPGFDLEDTASFQTGSNVWKRYAQFPPKEARSESLYLNGGGALSWAAARAEARTSYVSDPAQPIPYRQRPIQQTYGAGSLWGTWLLEDQRFVSERKDVAAWRTPALEHEVTLTGEVVADIFAATTGTDNDLVVKLIDEYPEDAAEGRMRGYQLMTNAEIFRGRYLDSFEHPAALKAGQVREYKFSLHDVDHVFKAGHRIMVEIQSSWFPLYDRNPQSFVKNIMTAKPEAYRAATISVSSGGGQGSRLLVPVVER